MTAPEAPGLSLGEGGTELSQDRRLGEWAGVETLWVKREDQNPTGSHKDRGARVQMEACVDRGNRVAVISSSGNAALAAATYGRAAGVTVVSLLSPMTEPARLQAIGDAGARVIVTTKPINYTTRLSRVRGWPDLRPSQSPEALAGFGTLAAELAGELEDGTAVFGYASSGTTYQALGEAFARRGLRLPLHPVQAGLVNGLSRAFGRPGDGTRSIVGDLGVKVSSRAGEVIALVGASDGQAWWVDDRRIREAGACLEERGYALAPECWAALAGVAVARESMPLGPVCLVLTGRAAGVGAATDTPGAAPAAKPDGEAPIGAVEQPATEFRQVLALVEDLP